MSFLKNVGQYLKTNKNSLSVGFGIGGMLVGSAWLAIGAIRANKKLEQPNLTKKDKAKIIAKEIAAPVAMEVIGAGMVITGFHSEHKGSAALATAYAISESALTEYKNKVVETVGERKEKEIRESIAQDKVDKLDISKTPVFATGNGNSVVYDIRTGIVFYSNEDAIKDAVFAINEKMLDEGYASINDLYREFNAPTPVNNEMFGFNINKGKLKVDICHPYGWGAPVITIDYDAYPDYDKYYK